MSLHHDQKPVEPVAIQPPPPGQRRKRNADFARPGEKRTRYSLPERLESSSPVGYRTRIPFTMEETRAIMPLLSLTRPTRFVDPKPLTEEALFEECSLGVLTARQSTNFRGHRQVTFGPEDSRRIAHLLRSLNHREREAAVLDNCACTHVVLSRPYRTPFTLLLTFLGHKPVISLGTVAIRALRKKIQHVDDIPSIGFLQQLHIGILADAMERATAVASRGTRKAQIFMEPFCSEPRRRDNKPMLHALEEMCAITPAEKAMGWRVALVAQTGEVPPEEQMKLPDSLWRKTGANLMALRSERIQPGVNQDKSAPPCYQERQDMDVTDELTVQAGRAAYNAFAHWTSCDRERAKQLLMLERVDVLTPNGKERIREIREMLNDITNRVVKNIPLWADLPTGKRLSRSAELGRKAFGMAGQRIYITGLSRSEIAAEGIDWDLAVRATGAAAARSSLYAELMGCTDIPENCDMLAGACLMAGPVNQNDVGKQFYGSPDLLEKAFPGRDPTSLLVWTLKAKTVTDPVGNEEQLLNPAQQGALVDLRPGPHEIIGVRTARGIEPMRKLGSQTNEERAFYDQGNFVISPGGLEIPGNRGSPWPGSLRKARVWG
ncbi:MAG: hypothetical protein GMKNLPBB_00114 [Myxococcota bacterium]|nr:hypothetical protein [Myxococcota bacterium]